MRKHIFSILFLFAFMICTSVNVYSQAGPPPPPGHGEEENQPAGIGGGLLILLGIAGAYGGKKVYDARKRLQ
ncbi:MAG: hypothetical protein ACLFN2_07995 [Bacteroidales bacterium]